MADEQSTSGDDRPDEPTAKEYVQDDARENVLRDLFGLKKPPESGRGGVDAILVLPKPHDKTAVEFELKSATAKGITTARDVGPQHIRKWRNKHWLIGFFDRSGMQLQKCLYASPTQMEPWLSRKEAYIKLDFELARLPQFIDRALYERLIVEHFGDKAVYSLTDAKKIQKRQYSKAAYVSRMDRKNGYSKSKMIEILAERWVYLTKRGATLNNPHILPGDFDSFNELIIDPPEKAAQSLIKAVIEVIRTSGQKD